MFATPSEVEGLFALGLPETIEARYNIAPSQNALGFVNEAGGQYRMISWGLTPLWAKERTSANRFINARAETIFVKPTFRASARHHRCLIPASGFFEWQDGGGRGPKLPYHFQMNDESAFAIGGLWHTWHDDQGSEIDEFALLTTFANDLVAPYHERMPVIVRKKDFAIWLDPKLQRPEDINGIMVPFSPAEMKATPVSPKMNNPRVEEGSNIVRAGVQSR